MDSCDGRGLFEDWAVPKTNGRGACQRTQLMPHAWQGWVGRLWEGETKNYVLIWRLMKHMFCVTQMAHTTRQRTVPRVLISVRFTPVLDENLSIFIESGDEIPLPRSQPLGPTQRCRRPCH